MSMSVHIKTELQFNELLKAVGQLNATQLKQLMSQIILLQAKQKSLSLSKKETELMLKINKGLPVETQSRFNELNKKRQEEILTNAEHKELLKLIDLIENSDAERVRYMTELAGIRGISLSGLIKELGIYPQ